MPIPGKSDNSEYWAVGHLGNGEWQVRKAKFSTPDEWEVVQSLGTNIVSACIEADGDFDYFPGDTHLSLVTEGMPWLALITESGNLYAWKVGTPASEAVLLDSAVKSVSIVRGWRSHKFDVDSGIIIAYTKEVGVFIRVYAPVSGTYIWQPVQIIAGISVESVQVKRLNDFRIGIFTVNPNKLYISERYYIGGTSKTEYLYPKYAEEFQVWSVTQQDGPHDDLRIENVELKDGIEFWVTANYPFVWRDNTWNDITAVRVSSGFSIDSYRIEDGYLIIRMNKAYESPYIHAEFRIKALNRIRFKRTDHSIPICPELDIIVDNPAKGYVTEQLYPRVSSVTCTFVAKTMTTYRGNHTENFQPSVSIDATFVAKEMTTYRGTTTETLVPKIDNIACTFVVEQTGVTPV